MREAIVLAALVTSASAAQFGNVLLRVPSRQATKNPQKRVSCLLKCRFGSGDLFFDYLVSFRERAVVRG